jgi:hypothetical protein
LTTIPHIEVVELHNGCKYGVLLKSHSRNFSKEGISRTLPHFPGMTWVKCSVDGSLKSFPISI